MKIISDDATLESPDNGTWQFKMKNQTVMKLTDDEAHAFLDCYDIFNDPVDTVKAAFGMYLVECLNELEENDFNIGLVNYIVSKR